ncbi:MAG: glycoside hydrolase family 25 protein [Chitinophagaceae bacterium]
MARSRKKLIHRLVFFFIGFFLAAAMALFGYLWWQEEKAARIRYKEFGIEIPSNYSIHGIDVSRYQQLIDWQSVKEMNVQGIQIEFVFIKATEGASNRDFLFGRNWRKAKDAGLHRGAYHFFIPSKDGILQARQFIGVVDLEPGDLPPVLDIEQANGTPKKLLQQRVRDWLVAVEAAFGVKPVIYTNIDFYEKYLDGSFDEYPLWVAHYLQPSAPRINRNWLFWQHSESGRVNGIAGKVDFNVFNGDSTALADLLLK